MEEEEEEEEEETRKERERGEQERQAAPPLDKANGSLTPDALSCTVYTITPQLADLLLLPGGGHATPG